MDAVKKLITQLERNYKRQRGVAANTAAQLAELYEQYGIAAAQQVDLEEDIARAEAEKKTDTKK